MGHIFDTQLSHVQLLTRPRIWKLEMVNLRFFGTIDGMGNASLNEICLITMIFGDAYNGITAVTSLGVVGIQLAAAVFDILKMELLFLAIFEYICSFILFLGYIT
ncbi:hypothetical protein ACJX0J_018986, partial [Zea mays]